MVYKYGKVNTVIFFKYYNVNTDLIDEIVAYNQVCVFVRLGGRVHTYDIGDHKGRSALIELGANFIHGTHGNAVYSLATEHNLLSPFVLLDRCGI